ncbi:MAG: GIY-YIG nuclease family protein, partial [Pseudomonadota bacterium]|nr:GIY-YIG nuclease family protein [Pseudomonadota bacterium]
ERRVRQHNGEIVGGANYTRARRPVALAWYKECENRSVAQQREYSVRRLSRREKQRLAAKAAVVKDDER